MGKHELVHIFINNTHICVYTHMDCIHTYIVYRNIYRHIKCWAPVPTKRNDPKPCSSWLPGTPQPLRACEATCS